MSPPTPLAPENLARAYADVAVGYHRKLPTLEKAIQDVDNRVSTVHGIALSAHGMMARMERRIEEIGFAVRAKRTFPSGSYPAVSVPSQPLTIRTRGPSQTGSHFLIDTDELDRLKAKFAEKEAEERGAKEALQMKEEEDQRREEKAESTRKRWGFYIGILVLVCSGAGWALGHLTLIR